MTLVLDAGALIAIERNDRTLWAALKRAAVRTQSVLVPSTVLAQIWRAAPRQAQLSKVLAHCVIAPFDSLVRDAGILCGESSTHDICDAHVALVAARESGTLYTSDPHDLKVLLGVLGARHVHVVRC